MQKTASAANTWPKQRPCNSRPTTDGKTRWAIYCDQPAKILVVASQTGSRRTVRAMPTMISLQTGIKVGGYGTTVDHVLAMAFDDPSMDDDLLPDRQYEAGDWTCYSFKATAHTVVDIFNIGTRRQKIVSRRKMSMAVSTRLNHATARQRWLLGKRPST